MSYFPAFLDIKDSKCVVVGGGAVAAQKVKSLLRSKACVQVVAKDLKAPLHHLVQDGKVAWVPRNFLPQDLKGASLVIAATDNAAVNQQVWKTAKQNRILVNVVDDPRHCNFIVPSIYKRGRLQVAISTGGSSPALAKKIRRHMHRVFGSEYATALDWMGAARPAVFARVASAGLRKTLFWKLAADIPETIKRLGRVRAKKQFNKHLQDLMKQYGNNGHASHR